jgi:sulfur-carrier protein
MNILLFGQLADAAGTKTLQLDGAADTDELIRHVERVCASLRGLTYIVAVDRRIIQSNTPLSPHTEIALLPPFSGG